MKKLRKSIASLLICLFMMCVMVPAIAADTGKVNINTDGKEILVTLKYVGEKLADRIIEYRKEQPFNTVEEIMDVKGIGTKIFEANKNRIIVKAP